jgi:hypothetical protein
MIRMLLIYICKDVADLYLFLLLVVLSFLPVDPPPLLPYASSKPEEYAR